MAFLRVLCVSSCGFALVPIIVPRHQLPFSARHARPEAAMEPVPRCSARWHIYFGRGIPQTVKISILSRFFKDV